MTYTNEPTKPVDALQAIHLLADDPALTACGLLVTIGGGSSLYTATNAADVDCLACLRIWSTREDARAYTPPLTLPAVEIDRLLIEVFGLHVQALDTGDEETWHDLTVVECEGVDCDADLPDECEGQCAHCPDDPPQCVLLASEAFPGGLMHTPPAELVSVRLAAAVTA